MLFAACSQTPQPADPASTVVNPDGTVTFNYRNDNAKNVEVSVQFAGSHAMAKNSVSGLWTLTLGPAAPDIYPYCFVVDGVSVMDPQNSQYFPNEGFKKSLLDIPGKDNPLIHAYQSQNPQGKVDYVTYYSSTIGCYNNALIYTPASYNPADNKRYPVFYLISGTTDTEEVYYKVGRMNTIIDNLIAEGKAEEMIIVLPYGNPVKLMDQPADFAMDLFSKDLINDLMPYVEANYLTINDAEHRAIGGFSRGGNQALSNGLMNLDKFSYLCSYSSFTSTQLPYVYDHAKETNSKINLFWLGIGTDDLLYKTSHDYIEFLRKKGINHMLEFTEGKFGHTWMNAKYFLAQTMPLLFNKEKAAEAMAQGGMPLPELKGDEEEFNPLVMMSRLFPPQVTSPEFGQGNVTFRIKAENAQEVLLSGEMLTAPMPMQRDSVGVWEITLADIVPDVYCYNYIVDGTEVMDPTNMYLAPEIGFKRSIVELPGSPYSINLGVNRDDPAKSIKYSPVRIQRTAEGKEYAMVIPEQHSEVIQHAVFLHSGTKATFQAWQKIGKAQQILDQMIASGECQPCKLYLVDDDSLVPNDAIALNADNFATWSEARKALVETLKKL